MLSKRFSQTVVSGAVRGAALLVLAVALGVPGTAAPMIMQVVSTDSAHGGAIWLSADGQRAQDYAGLINITLDGTAYKAVCVDLFTGIGYETLSVNPFSPDTLVNVPRAAWLYATQIASINSVVMGESLQLAIWDVVHDGGDGLSAGRVRASTTSGYSTPTAVVNAAAQYISLSSGHTSDQASLLIAVEGVTAKQALLTSYIEVPPLNQEDASVPEPSGLILSGLGVVCLGVALYRKERRRAVAVPVSPDREN